MDVFLDMDNVIVDWTEPALNNWGVYNYYERHLSFRGRKAWNIGAAVFPDYPARFWNHANFNSEGWWASLPKTAWADDLVHECVTRADNVYIATSPTLHAACVPGKRAWIRTHYPALLDNMCFISKKWLMARHDRILVDDRSENCKSWSRAGGTAVLVPAYWNEDFQNTSDAHAITVNKTVRAIADGYYGGNDDA